MKTCRALVKIVNGEAVLCGRPAFQIRDMVPICFDHLKELKAREKK